MSDEMHPNLAIMGQLDIADLDSCREIFSDDFVWHYFNAKLPELAGDYSGVSGLQEFFAKLTREGDGEFQVQPLDVRPLGDELVVVHALNQLDLGEGKGGLIEFHAAVIWRIVDGKITEAWDIPSIHTVSFKSSL